MSIFQMRQPHFGEIMRKKGKATEMLVFYQSWYAEIYL